VALSSLLSHFLSGTHGRERGAAAVDSGDSVPRADARPLCASYSANKIITAYTSRPRHADYIPRSHRTTHFTPPVRARVPIAANDVPGQRCASPDRDYARCVRTSISLSGTKARPRIARRDRSSRITQRGRRVSRKVRLELDPESDSMNKERSISVGRC